MGGPRLALTYPIETGPSGPEVGAFFDLDGTLLAGFSALALVRDRLANGLVTARDLTDVTMSALSFRRGGLGFAGMMAAMARMLRGTSERELEETCQRLFDEQLVARVYEDARTLVEAHRAQAHTLCVVSAATRYQAEPVARDVGIPDLLCTKLEVKGGRLTGRVLGPTYWGEGKLGAARDFARERGIDLGKSYFYSDGYEDLPLLDAVGQPCPTNPDHALEDLARIRRWPVLQLDRRDPPLRRDGARTALALSLLPHAALSSVAAACISGRFRAPLNLCVQGWSDALMRIVGVELGVRGRRHLDSHRPALFVFNRQSALDPLIVGRLLRRDFAPLLRREIAKSRLYRVVDAVAQNSFLEEPKSAGDADAHERALRTLRDGISITVDPETTRTPTPRLAPFRTAPFRIAADAGVPVVPIVIRDSAEALPGGALVVRSRSVNVEVLKPISTSAWTPRTLRHHIDAVHAQFEEVLDSLREDRLSSRPSSSPSGGATTSCAPSSA